MAIRKIFLNLHLSEEEFEELSVAHARMEVAMSGHPSITPEAAIEWIRDYYRTERKFRIHYQIPDDEQVAFSLVDGAIMEVDDG
jgi:hypothetical protein